MTLKEKKQYDKLLEKYQEVKSKLDGLKHFVKPVYEFSDFGNYPSLTNIVKTMQINIAECQDFYDD